jgi:hypothetical protein
MASRPALWKPDRYTSRNAACSKRSRVRSGSRGAGPLRLGLFLRTNRSIVPGNIPISMQLTTQVVEADVTSAGKLDNVAGLGNSFNGETVGA